MNSSGANGLRVLSSEEAEGIERRLRALRAFDRHYAASPTSLRTMRGALRRIATTYSGGQADEMTFPWESLIDETLTQDVVDKLRGRYASSTLGRDSAALRYLVRCLRQTGAMSSEEARSACSFDSGARRADGRPLSGRLVEDGELRRLLERAASSPNRTLSVRNTALVYVAASSGARRAELSAMKLADVKWQEAAIFIPHGKGNRSRSAWLHSAALAALRSWLQVRGRSPGHLFNPVDRFERIDTDRPLSAHQIWKVVTELARAEGMDPVTPHDMRRFVVSNLLETHDITLVSKAVGHAQISTTARYDRRPAARARAAIEGLPLPDIDSLTVRSQDGASLHSPVEEQ